MVDPDALAIARELLEHRRVTRDARGRKHCAWCGVRTGAGHDVECVIARARRVVERAEAPSRRE